MIGIFGTGATYEVFENSGQETRSTSADLL